MQDRPTNQSASWPLFPRAFIRRGPSGGEFAGPRTQVGMSDPRSNVLGNALGNFGCLKQPGNGATDRVEVVLLVEVEFRFQRENWAPK
jgi:hypothetical protein